MAKSWREPENYANDCYYCIVNINGLNTKNHSKWVYPDLLPARHQLYHSDEVPIPTFPQLSQLHLDEFILSDVPCDRDQGSNSHYGGTSLSTQSFNQNELIALTRDIRLSKESSEFLASMMNKSTFEHGTKIYSTVRGNNICSPFLPGKQPCIASRYWSTLYKNVLT